MRHNYNFDASIETYEFNRYVYSAIYVPDELRDRLALDNYPRLRIDGLIAGTPFQGACQPAGSRRWYLMLSKKFLKQAQIAIGDRVTVEFDVSDQDAVDIPQELQFALDACSTANAKWKELTPGKQRGFAYRVSSAKRAATRANRVEEILELLRDE